MMNGPSELLRQLDRAVEELRGYGAQRIIVFGSVARGDADEYSDLDLIVVKPTTMGFVERLGDVVRRCPSAQGANVIVYTPEEIQRMQEAGNPFLKHALSEGKVVYEKAAAGS